MKRIFKFLRIVLGDFFCDQVLPMLWVVAFVALCWGLSWLVGTAVVYWFGFDPIKAPSGEDAPSVLGILVVFSILAAALFIAGAVKLILWLRSKWEEAG
jgi:hypothetical protein